MSDHHAEEWIRQRAYVLWEEEGYPQGKDREHWERASLEYATLVRPGEHGEAAAEDVADSADTAQEEGGEQAEDAGTQSSSPFGWTSRL